MKPVKGKIYEIVYVPTFPIDNDEAYNGLGRCTEDSAVGECKVGDLYEFKRLSGDQKGNIGLYADEDIISEKQEGRRMKNKNRDAENIKNYYKGFACKNRDLDQIKEDCKEFVCSKAQEIVNDVSISDEWDLDCLQDDLNHLLDICEKIDRCRGVKSIKRVMSKHYSVQEINKIINS